MMKLFNVANMWQQALLSSHRIASKIQFNFAGMFPLKTNKNKQTNKHANKQKAIQCYPFAINIYFPHREVIFSNIVNVVD